MPIWALPIFSKLINIRTAFETEEKEEEKISIKRLNAAIAVCQGAIGKELREIGSVFSKGTFFKKGYNLSFHRAANSQFLHIWELKFLSYGNYHPFIELRIERNRNTNNISVVISQFPEAKYNPSIPTDQIYTNLCEVLKEINLRLKEI